MLTPELKDAITEFAEITEKTFSPAQVNSALLSYALARFMASFTNEVEVIAFCEGIKALSVRIFKDVHQGGNK